MNTVEAISKFDLDVMGATARARRILERCHEIATYTEVPGEITRTFLSEPMRGVYDLLQQWMTTAGMKTSLDAAGNLRAVYRSPRARSRVILGSHIDTVPNAGAYDGILGVVMAIALVEEAGSTLPFDIEVIGFAEEEGVRFRRPFLGSLACVDRLNEEILSLRDGNNLSVAEVIRDFGLDLSGLAEAKLTPESVLFLEIHIEQGPILERLNADLDSAELQSSPRVCSSAAFKNQVSETTRRRRVLGVVDGIAGQSRLIFTFRGESNHAGTTPMHDRRDALAAAAEWITAVEEVGRNVSGLVATVGKIEAHPGASNVIAGLVRVTLDVRHSDDAVRVDAVEQLVSRASAMAASRKLAVSHEVVLEQGKVSMDMRLVGFLEEAVSRIGHVAHRITSGAGHDAMILAPRVPSVMLFLPSPGGRSHDPAESVCAVDVEAALQAVLEFLQSLSVREVAEDA